MIYTKWLFKNHINMNKMYLRVKNYALTKENVLNTTDDIFMVRIHLGAHDMVMIIGNLRALNMETQIQIFYKAVCISHCVNTLGKSMHPTINQPQLGANGADWALSLCYGNHGKLWIQTSYTLLKNWPCFISCCWKKGWTNTQI